MSALEDLAKERPCPSKKGGKVCCYPLGHDEKAFPHRYVYERAF